LRQVTQPPFIAVR